MEANGGQERVTRRTKYQVVGGYLTLVGQVNEREMCEAIEEGSDRR